MFWPQAVLLQGRIENAKHSLGAAMRRESGIARMIESVSEPWNSAPSLPISQFVGEAQRPPAAGSKLIICVAGPVGICGRRYGLSAALWHA